MQYIYESPDKGKTVYRRPFNNPDAERELIIPKDEGITILCNDEGCLIVLEQGPRWGGFLKEGRA